MGLVIVQSRPLGESHTDAVGIIENGFHETPGAGIENRSVEISGEVDIFHSHVFAPVSDGFFDEFFHTSPAHNDDIFGQSDMVAVEGTASLDEIIVTPLPAVSVLRYRP